jgi:hypothetical protein
MPGSGAWSTYSFHTSYYTNTNSAPFALPQNTKDVYYMYGIDNATSGGHIMPFNRVDYYLDKVTVAGVPVDFPSSCVKDTYTLYRSTINQATNGNQAAGTLNKTPLVDCVKDFQVAFGLDPSGNNSAAIQWQANLFQQPYMLGYVANAQMNASQIQQYLREVRVFLLYQEGLGTTSASSGQGSSNFAFSGVLNLGDQDIANSLDPTHYPTVPNNFQQWSPTALPGTPQLNAPGFTPSGLDLPYRWKITEISVKPMNPYIPNLR